MQGLRTGLGTRRRVSQAVVWAAVVLLPTLATAAQDLQRSIRDLMAKGKLGSAEIGVCVVDAGSGEVLAAVNDRQPLIPASNLKIMSSGAALLVLGKDYEFRTSLVRDGDRLVIVGSGDPAFGDPELLKAMNLSASAFLDRLAEPIIKAGVGGFREVVLDDRIFDRDAIHPTWPVDQLNRWYCAEVSGLNFHTNVLQIFATGATRPGQTATLRTEPSAEWIELTNQVMTTGTGSSALAVMHEPGPGYRFRATGSVRSVVMEPVEVTVKSPAMLLGRAIADRIQAAGLATGTLEVRFAEPTERFSDAPALAVVRTPMRVVLKRCNADSHNLYAESLLKRIGHEVTAQPGSWSNGAAVVRMQIAERITRDCGEFVMVDGSGMSRENRITPALLAQWLAMLSRQPDGVFETYYESLAVPGQGSWSNRFRDLIRLNGEFRGKSGFVRDVLCLSGFVTNQASGRRVALSILVNKTGEAQPGKVREFQESVVKAVDAWMAGGARPGRGG